MLNQCVICGGSPDEQHHLHPRYLGGEEKSPTVTLCGSHHAKVHYVANRILKGKAIDENPEFLIRAKPIIDRIVHYTLAAQTKDMSKVETRLVINLTKGMMQQIKLRKTDSGFSSVEKYVLNLIERDLAK